MPDYRTDTPPPLFAPRLSVPALREALDSAPLTQTGAAHPGTAHAASAKLRETGAAKRQAERCLELLREYPNGLTDDEVDALTGFGHSSATSRMSGLRKVGLVEFTSERRMTRAGNPACVNRLKGNQ